MPVSRLMPDDAEARRIAQGLTPAQKRALLWLPTDGSWTTGRVPRLYSGGCSSLVLYGRGAISSWILASVGGPRAYLRYRLYDLGLRVRAILQEAAHD